MEVELILTTPDNTILDTRKLDLVAGLLGVEQAEQDGAISPAISWCLAKRPPA